MKRRTLFSCVLATLLTLCCLGAPIPIPSANLPRTALAEDSGTESSTTFAYQHSPLYNPKAMADIVENPDAVYGFSPNPDSGSLSPYATYDWTDPEFVAQARENRLAYLLQDQQIFDLVIAMDAEGATIEEIARAASAERNRIRLDSYQNDPEGLEKLKTRNLEKYGNEEGPTPEWLYDRYGSWEGVLENAFNTNPGMDACCGFYDDNYEKYLHFGQIPQYAVLFDAAGHGVAPSDQLVYAGETAREPEDLVEDGWTFLGWSVDGTGEDFDFASPVESDLRLVALWEEAAEAEPEPEPEPGSDSEPDPDHEPNSGQEEELGAEPGTEPEAEPGSEAGTESDPEPTKESEPEPTSSPAPTTTQPGSQPTQTSASGSSYTPRTSSTSQLTLASTSTPRPLAALVSRTSQQPSTFASRASSTASVLPKSADPTSASACASLFLAGVGSIAAGLRLRSRHYLHRTLNRR